MLEVSKKPEGIICIPSSKSFAHRYLIAGFLSKTNIDIGISSLSDDVNRTLIALEEMGREIHVSQGRISFKNVYIKPKKVIDIDVGESGTTLRFLLALLLALEIKARVFGSERVLNRQNEPFIQVLNKHGGKIKRHKDFYEVDGRLLAGQYTLAGNISSQFISALLFALSTLSSQSEIILSTPLESKPYVDMTVDVLSNVNGNIQVTETESICGQKTKKHEKYIIYPSELNGSDIDIEGDFSNASFFLVAMALGANVTLRNLQKDSLQGDRYICNFFETLGATIKWDSNNELHCHYDKNDLKAEKDILFDATQYPDLVPPVVAFLVHQKGHHKIIGAKRLKIKESDRLEALRKEFGTLGAKIEKMSDGLHIIGREPLKSSVVDSHNDHRIAMALAATSVGMKDSIYIQSPEVVNKSYASFWQDFLKVRK